MKQIPFLLSRLVLAGALCFSTGLQAAHPLRVIVETDMGNDIDDALALDVLYKAADAKQVQIIGISNHKKSDYASTYIGILNTWYGYPKIPIAKSPACVSNQEAKDYTEDVCNLKDEQGNPLYKRSRRPIEESISFYRRTLSQQPDHSVAIISLGFGTDLALLLKSQADKYSKLSGIELVRQKVKQLSMMAGSFGPHQRAEFNVVNDISSMQYVFNEWPTPIVVNPFEVGKAIIYPGTVISNDFTWTHHHPVVDGYTHYHQMPYNRPTWDVLSVVYLLHPEMFTISEKCTISIDDKGFMNLSVSETGKHQVLSVNEAQVQALKEYIIKQTTRKPLRAHPTNNL